MKCKVILATAVAAMVSSAVFAAGRTMLAVPARHDMVGFGFDMLRQLPDNLELACYKGDDRIERLEIFDRTAWEWRTISAENWAAGIRRADSLVVAGENKAAADLLALSGWTRQTRMPSDRAKLDIAKAVNEFQPLTESQWMNLAHIYGFKFTKIERPSPREQLRDKARARRQAERARREQEKAQREREKELERQRKLLTRKRPEPQVEVVPVRIKPAPAPVEVRPAPTPVEVKPAPAPAEVKPAPMEPKHKPIVLLAPVEVKPAPVEAEPAPVEVKPAPAARIKTPAIKTKVPKAPVEEDKTLEVPDIVFRKREPAVKAPAVKAPEVKAPEVNPTEAEAKVKAAVEAAVSEAAAKEPKAEAPAAVEIRVPAKEAVAPTHEAPAVPEVKVPEAKPIEVSVPEVKTPEVKPVQTPEIKVPAIVLDPM